jgi:hypothetical protein
MKRVLWGLAVATTVSSPVVGIAQFKTPSVINPTKDVTTILRSTLFVNEVSSASDVYRPRR